MILDKLFIGLCRIPGLQKSLWRRWYGYLAGHYGGADWTFMNYGFDDPASRPMLDSSDEPDRYCIQLYNHVAGAVPLRGLDVLEIGSGRGGGASFVARYLKPARMTGVDLSEEATRLCQRTHRVAGLDFKAGDAEQLPFESSVFDAAINVESSHCYPNLSRFFGEVARVLKPGGVFLYADFRDRDKVAAWRRVLSDSGFTIETETDITERVVKALDCENDRKLALMDRAIPRILHGAVLDFAGVRGSKMYENFHSGALAYVSFVARKNR
jgi:ubiquinone/menaquinone biosynthesis C-methylase UbiE